MGDLKVSVIVATYRRNCELERALESLAMQTYNNFEIIVVDDNDEISWNTLVRQIVNEFQKKNAHIPIIRLENHPRCGSAMARNVGISASQGEYITFLDDDDVYLPEKIKRQLEFMVFGKLDYSITELSLYYDDGKQFEYRKRDYIKKKDLYSLIRYHMMYHLTGTDTMMFTKEYLLEIGGFPSIDLGDEFYLMERAILKNGRFDYLPRCDVKAFVHQKECGLSSGQSKIDGENILFEHKKKYFSRFDKKTIRYIKMRHHAVLTFSFYQQNKVFSLIKEAFLSFVSSPYLCIYFLLKR